MIFIYLAVLTMFFAVSIFIGLTLLQFATRVIQEAIEQLFGTGDESPVFTWLTFAFAVVIMLIMIVAPPVGSAVIVANQPAAPAPTAAPLVIFMAAPTPTAIPTPIPAPLPVSIKPHKCEPVLFGNLFCAEDQ
jgi:hypothetical protein